MFQQKAVLLPSGSGCEIFEASLVTSVLYVAELVGLELSWLPGVCNMKEPILYSSVPPAHSPSEGFYHVG